MSKEVNLDDVDFAIIIGRRKDGTPFNEWIGDVDEWALSSSAYMLDALAQAVIKSLIVRPDDEEV